MESLDRRRASRGLFARRKGNRKATQPEAILRQTEGRTHEEFQVLTKRWQKFGTSPTYVPCPGTREA